MGYPDTITTIGAAFYGLAVASKSKASSKTKEPEPQDPEKKSPIAPVEPVNKGVLPPNWADAPDKTKAEFKQAASFLQSFLRGSAAVDPERRDPTALALADVCKGTIVAEHITGPGYRQMVEIFCAMRQGSPLRAPTSCAATRTRGGRSAGPRPGACLSTPRVGRHWVGAAPPNSAAQRWRRHCASAPRLAGSAW